VSTKHKKRLPTELVTGRKCKFKLGWDTTSYLPQWLKWKGLIIPRADKDGQQQETLCTFSVSVKMYD
jgi:hypothetical protein